MARNSFCCESGLCCLGFAFVVALQRVAQTIPDGIVRRHLRQLFEFVHDGIHHILERLFEISILLFAADCTQFQRKLQQLLSESTPADFQQILAGQQFCAWFPAPLRSRLCRQYLSEHRPLSTHPHRSCSSKQTANVAACLCAEIRISGHLTRASCGYADDRLRHETLRTSEAATVESAWLPQSLPVWSAEAPASLRRYRSQAARHPRDAASK